MTRVSYNVTSGINRTIYTDIKSYPEAVVLAANVKGKITTVYTPVEIKDETRAKDRLVARLA